MEDSFLQFLKQDVISNFFGLQDMKFHRDKTEFWIALEGDEIFGYMLEFDGKSLTIRGDVRCTTELLKNATLTEPFISIEPHHLPIVGKLYEPVKPLLLIDHKISPLLNMEVDRPRFKPQIKHRPKKMTANEYDTVGKLAAKVQEEFVSSIYPPSPERIVEALKRERIAYGIYEGGKLVSFACGRPNSVAENLSYVGPVYTSPKFRGRGYATSICSALVDELLDKSEKITLGVSENNPAALKVYERIGFAKTGHKFLAFWGRRLKS
jgi:GNAT superfamily N-acetyltransferase